MEIQHVRHHVQKRAASLNVKVQDTAGCSALPISWDASAGKAPWTVMIAPVNQVPYTLSVPQASGSSFTVNCDVPKLSKDTNALVAVADASGSYSGVSSLFAMAAGTGSCASMNDGLDFIWYPSSNSDSPSQCSSWGISWDQDKGTGGVSGQVTFTFLPEGGQPVTTTAGTGNSGKFKYTVPFASGTKFLAIGNDGGKAGTGGVGDLYTVSAAKKSAKACKASGIFGNGLPSPSGTLSSGASTSTSASSASSKGSKTSSAVSSTGSTKSTSGGAQNTSTDSTDGKSNTAGTAVGATFGVLGALALIGVLIWWLRRRNARHSEEEKAWGGAPRGGVAGATSGSGHTSDGSYPISPWRWSASPYEPPQTTSRTSKWLGRASGAGVASGGFRVLGRGKNEDHGRSESWSSSVKPSMQQSTFRNLSQPQQDYSLNTIAPNPIEHHQNFPRSPSPTYSQRNMMSSNQSVHSTVPDTALFPPPNPRAMTGFDDSPYGIARQQQQQQQHEARTPYLQTAASRSAGQGVDSRSRSPFEDPLPPPPPPPPHAQGNISGVGAAGMPMHANDYYGPTSEVRQGTSPHLGPTSQINSSRNLLSSSQIDEQDAQLAGHGMRPAMSGSSDPFSNQQSAKNGQRIPPPILSEVMMPEGRFARKAIPEEDEEDSLPYL